jgi:hypothetical protein
MRRLRYSLLLVPLLLTGCGKSESVKVYPVSGQVMYNGQPAAGVKVFLFPTSAPMVPRIPSNPRGETDNDVHVGRRGGRGRLSGAAVVARRLRWRGGDRRSPAGLV